MQSAPPEVSPNTTSVVSSHDTATSYQHGLHADSDSALDGLGQRPTVDELPQSADDNDAISITSDATSRGRRSDNRWMSSRDSSSQEGSPGSRIEAYEKAHAVPRKVNRGSTFQVIPSAGNAQSRVSILEFPNEVLTHILSHLPPETLSMMSLVNSRFHHLVTTPPAWRIAFARYFPGAESTGLQAPAISVDQDVQRLQRRSFTRVSMLASWRSEYILRTRLLRSLARGKPAMHMPVAAGASKQKSAPTAILTYGSGLMYPVSHIHANFGSGLNKKQPLFVHGAVEQGIVSSSDPTIGKANNWGLADFEAFRHFADVFGGEVEYGLGTGDVVGMPNVMDISQSFGKLYGEALPGGRLFYTSTTEQRGRFLMVASMPNYDHGIPEVNMGACAITSVWLAKSEAVLRATNGLVGALAGAANGVLSAYAIGTSPVYERRFDKGELTARWAICPGVPIVAISVDDKISARRIGRQRIWATVLNALGEVYYLVDIPLRADIRGKLSETETDRLAWQTGRTVQWYLLEMTRRAAKIDPFDTGSVDGSYTPRSSSNAEGLSVEQLKAEAREVETFLRHAPKHFRQLCEGWDMRRKMVVDYAGDDRYGGGESIFIVNCGNEEGSPSSIRRFTKHRVKAVADFDLEPYPAISVPQQPSIFGKANDQSSSISSPAAYSAPRSRTSSTDDLTDTLYHIHWHASDYSFGILRNLEISTLSTDDSDIALLAATEDPLLGMSTGSNTSSPLASPMGQASQLTSPSEIPGHRARMFAVGTRSGVVLLWDMRASMSPAVDIINTVHPARIIYTKSPQISSLVMSSLYVVHGGNDGLVQAWDVLASTNEPVRTLNSRFSDRARRRIAQAEASAQGVGNNYFAAGAIAVDPDPTVLRGIVSLGTHLRYWSYSASGADAYKSRKRGQLRRRSDRGSNSTATDQKYHHTGRGVLRDYITDERLELEREKLTKQKQNERLVNRFGTNLLGEGASEEQILAYATMLSEEAHASDAAKRQASPPISAYQPASSHDVLPEAMDAALEEAIRQSLLDTNIAHESPQTTDFDIPIRFAKSSKHGTPKKRKGVASPSTSSSAWNARSSRSQEEEDEDLKFALQLSLAEQESSQINSAAGSSRDDISAGGQQEWEEFPELSKASSSDGSVKGKGKGRGRRR